jgi:hypothetical protein
MALKDIIKLHGSKKIKLNAKQIAERKATREFSEGVLETIAGLALWNPAIRSIKWGYQGIKGGLSAAQKLKDKFKGTKLKWQKK